MRFGDSRHTVIHDDCLKALSAMPSASVDLVFADPPYNIGKTFGDFSDSWPDEDSYFSWSSRWLCECFRILKPTGSLYVMASTQAMPFMDMFVRKHMTILSRIVWSYDSSGVQAKKYFGSMYEPIIFAVKDKKSYTFNADDILIEARTGAVRKLIDYRGDTPKPYNTKKVPGNVWAIPRVRYRMGEYEEHPSQKPVALLERVIRASTNVDDLILDPFSGTFTTSAVAKSLDRRSIGIERHLEYVKIGLRRVLHRQKLDEELLVPVTKNTVRKNFNGIKASSPASQGGLFDVDC